MLRNRILLMLFILGSGILVGFRGGSVSYLLFYSSLILPVLALMNVFLVYLKFCIYQSIESKVLIKEERVPYLFKLSNEDFISYTKIQVNFMKDYADVENMDQATNYSLLPGEEIHKETKICCHYRGEYKVGIDYVTVSDFLSLFQFTYACNSTIEVKVLPRILHLSKLAIAPRSEDIKKQQYLIQSKQVIPDVEVRMYQPTDTPKMIHWKATARQGQLLTRKYTDDPKSELVLLIDLQRINVKEKERMMIEDKIIEAALAIADYFVRNHTPVSVIFDSTGVEKIHIYSKDDLNQFYKFCSEVRFHSKLTGDALLALSMQESDHKKYSMLLTGSVDEELCKASYQYIAFENELNIILVGEKNQQEIIDHIPDRVNLYRIRNTQEVQDVLEVEGV